MIDELRKATATHHRQVEELTLGERILDGSLSPTDYRRIITWQRRVHEALEPELQGFTAGDYNYRSRAEVLDFPAPAPAPREPATVLGIAYVVEGSSLGGRIIHRKLLENPSLGEYSPFPFYASQAEHISEGWKPLLAYLKTAEFSAAERKQAVEGAVMAFKTFAALWR